MAESKDEKWTVDKLSDSNWMTWKFQMRDRLLAKGIWDDTEVLAEGVDAAAQTEFGKKSQKAFSTIVMAISTPSVIPSDIM